MSNRHKNLRKAARDKYYDILLAKFMNRCYLCGCHVVKETHLIKSNIFYLNHGQYVLVYMNNKFIRVAKSSIDHIIPLSKGGDNNINNLALACQRCNKEKSNKVPQTYLTIGKMAVE